MESDDPNDTFFQSFIFTANVKAILRSEGLGSAPRVSLRIHEHSRESESHPASSDDPPFVESAWKKGLGEDFEVKAIGMRESLASRSLRKKKKESHQSYSVRKSIGLIGEWTVQQSRYCRRVAKALMHVLEY